MWGNLISSIIQGADSAARTYRDDYYYHANDRRQRKTIQNRVNDARAAGIHPLAALGVNSAATPSIRLGSTPDMSGLGQSIDRAINATQTRKDREYTEEVQRLTLERMELENDVIRGQSTGGSHNQPQNPPMSSGAGNSIPNTVVRPAEHTASHSGKTSDAGYHNDVSFVWTGTGYALLPSKNSKDLTDDDFIASTSQKIRSHVKSFQGASEYKPPRRLLPKGFDDWEFKLTVYGGEWRPVKSRRRLRLMPSHLPSTKKRWNKSTLK